MMTTTDPAPDMDRRAGNEFFFALGLGFSMWKISEPWPKLAARQRWVNI